ncbi:MAG TPA: hypothetical protein ENN31_01855 [Candidatus Vogelbacteria bacterium]|nr:hypothetical protein [Candidatus Vogelbacteria bacterium]
MEQEKIEKGLAITIGVIFFLIIFFYLPYFNLDTKTSGFQSIIPQTTTSQQAEPVIFPQEFKNENLGLSFTHPAGPDGLILEMEGENYLIFGSGSESPENSLIISAHDNPENLDAINWLEKNMPNFSSRKREETIDLPGIYPWFWFNMNIDDKISYDALALSLNNKIYLAELYYQPTDYQFLNLAFYLIQSININE